MLTVSIHDKETTCRKHVFNAELMVGARVDKQAHKKEIDRKLNGTKEGRPKNRKE